MEKKYPYLYSDAVSDLPIKTKAKQVKKCRSLYEVFVSLSLSLILSPASAAGRDQRHILASSGHL